MNNVLSIKQLISRILLYAALIGLFIIVIFPFYWMLLTSIQPASEVYKFPPNLIPKGFRWQNYVEAWNAAPWGRYFLNTLFIAFSTMILSLITSSLTAFAFATLRFPFKNALFAIFLSVMMIPAGVTIVPNFIIIKTLGWYNTYAALIIPFSTSVFGIFLMRQFFLQLPPEMWEAAQIDGASRMRFFFEIALPMAAPAVVTISLNTFLGSWHAFLWPLVMTTNQKIQPIEVALRSFLSEQSTNWTLLASASVFTTLPVLILFFIAQKQFIEGIGRSGVKG